MGEKEFIQRMKEINRFLSSDSRQIIWDYVWANGKVPVEKLSSFWKEIISQDLKES